MRKGTLAALLVIAAASVLRGGGLDIQFKASGEFNGIFHPFMQKNIRTVRYIHFAIREGLSDHSFVEKGAELGRAEKYPDMLGKNPDNDKLIRQAMDLYDKKQYIGAAEILERIYDAESDNPHYLNVLARTLFWINDRKAHDRSIAVYERLVSLIDSSAGTTDDVLIVDVWFMEAYWKLGCLYLDERKYDRAVYEISRSMLLGSGSTDDNYLKMMDQKYSYLTEAYYFLNDRKLNEYFYNTAIRNNPKNTYVLKYRLQ